MFTKKTVSFLRALKRNNDRDWFKARKGDYEAHVRGPMVALLSRLEADLRTFAPELVSHPKVSLFRIYRDTRFSGDKSPLKTQAAAHFPHKSLRKRGAGLYLEVAPQWVWIGGGIYMPETSELQAIREHIAANHRRLRRVIGGAPFRRAVGEMHGEQLTRVPRGFRSDHPAAELLRYRQFLAGAERPAEFAFSPRFYGELLSIFRAVAPLVRFLNEPLVNAPAAPLNLAFSPHLAPANRRSVGAELR
jgi:uncharacterized protein (TIGR02453 family)